MPDVPVTITITVNTTNDDQKIFSISVDKEPVILDDTVLPNEGIEWNIVADPPEWTFTKDRHSQSDGVTVKNHLGKFGDRKGANNKNHRWDRLAKEPVGTGPKKYRYTISVTNETATSPTNPRTTLSWDPTIQNN